MSDFGEEDIRRIVREELKILLANITKAAQKGQGYDTGELEDSALNAIKSTMGRAVQDFDHEPECYSRDKWSNCDCGLERRPPDFG